jgi:phage terminase large subunit-like protein
MQQTYKGMAVPTHEFERAIYSANIATNDHEIINWQITCVELKSDRQGNIMPMKPERSTAGKRIDGVVAAIMAYYRAYVTDVSPYESGGVFTV